MLSKYMSSFLYRGAEFVSRVLGVPSSQLFPSPSKFFLLRKLVVCLNQSVGMSVGLDAACADFKYRDLFRTDRYVGVDLEPANLNRGLALRARSTDLGVLANLLHLERAPGVADVVVSTHTLASLPENLREEGVRALAGTVIANGTLFLNLPSESDSDELFQFLRERFGVVERTVYGAPLFMGVEDFFAHRTGSKNPIVLAALGLSIVLCYMLSFLEEVPWIRARGAYTLYWCRNRKSEGIESRLALLKGLEVGC